MIIGSRLYDCHYGRDRKENVREANKLKKLLEMVCKRERVFNHGIHTFFLIMYLTLLTRL